MASGLLPLDAPMKMFAGYGTGSTCTGCNEVIDRAQVEYEAEYPDRRVYLLHLTCASVWEAERRRRQEADFTKDAKRIQEQSEAVRERARTLSKRSAELHDQADVLARESEAGIENAKQVRRGDHNGKGVDPPSPKS